MSGEKAKVLHNSASNVDSEEWLDVSTESVWQPSSLSFNLFVSLLVETTGLVLDFSNSDPQYLDEIDRTN